MIERAWLRVKGEAVKQRAVSLRPEMKTIHIRYGKDIPNKNMVLQLLPCGECDLGWRIGNGEFLEAACTGACGHWADNAQGICVSPAGKLKESV